MEPPSRPTFTLVIPEDHEGQVLAAAARFPDLPVRVVPPGIVEVLLVRPDGYVAGRGGAGDAARLLGQLARMLGTAGIAVGAQLP